MLGLKTISVQLEHAAMALLPSTGKRTSASIDPGRCGSEIQHETGEAT
jgi:hypothetical protein